ncbi:pVII [Red-eared slider adenovirus 1]|uniref:pVII n=1 Tax=Red-eared slider adenovirus 1 TaxID=2749458 RepID=UPI0024819E19|nr:pVII [Red-eared slider adenovirus 1]QLD29003.1 pVII [Red-eared slider adenovirus 1]
MYLGLTSPGNTRGWGRRMYRRRRRRMTGGSVASRVGHLERNYSYRDQRGWEVKFGLD